MHRYTKRQRSKDEEAVATIFKVNRCAIVSWIPAGGGGGGGIARGGIAGGGREGRNSRRNRRRRNSRRRKRRRSKRRSKSKSRRIRITSRIKVEQEALI